MCPSVLKKTTVREISVDVESLESRFEAFETQNERINVLEKKVEEPENNLKDLKEVIKVKSIEHESELFVCKVCNYNFKHKRELKNYIGIDHPKTLKCQYCDDNFDQRWKLENHMKTHNQAKSFKCENCEKSFLLLWRLITHKKMHENTKTKYCH